MNKVEMPNTGTRISPATPTKGVKTPPVKPLGTGAENVMGSHNIHKNYLQSISPKIQSLIDGMFQSDNTTAMPVKDAFNKETKKIAAAKKDWKASAKEKAEFALGGMMPLLAGYGAGTLTGDVVAPRVYKAITKKPLNLSPRARMAMGVLSALALGGAHALRLKKNSEKKNGNKKRKHSGKNRTNPTKVPNRKPLAGRHERYSYPLPERSLQSDDFGGVQVRTRKGPLYDGHGGGRDGDNNNGRNVDRYKYRRKTPRYHRFS